MKVLKKLEVKAAKQAAKLKYGKDAEVRRTYDTSDEIQELLPLPEQQGDIKGLRTYYKMDTEEGKVGFFKDNFQQILDNPIKIKQVDVEKLKPSEVEGLINLFNGHAGDDLMKPARTVTEKNARMIASELRNLLNSKMENWAVATDNLIIHKANNALKRFGIKGRLGEKVKN
jgi:hypothetical protein